MILLGGSYFKTKTGYFSFGSHIPLQWKCLLICFLPLSTLQTLMMLPLLNGAKISLCCCVAETETLSLEK